VPKPTTQPTITDEITLARYPFLPQASGWIQQMAAKHNISLDDLLEGSLMEPARKRARIRLVDSVQSKDGVELSGGDIHTEEGRLIEAFSFYYARLVICASEDERLLARWAQAEAARAEHLLIRDSQNLHTIANTYISVLEQSSGDQTSQRGMVATDIQSLRQSQDGLEWKLSLSDFIEVCPRITGNRWRLPNCDIDAGMVRLHNEQKYSSTAKLARLLREHIKSDVEQEGLEKMREVTTDLAIRLAEPVGMVRNLLAQKTSDAIALVGAEEDDWPPCMRKAVADLSAGVNVNHFGRLFLASMASTLALPQEACVDFFRGAPDFDEGTTTYQVGHVYQHGYTPSGCGKLKVNHNCPVLPGDDRLCDQPWLDHPLKYIRATQRRKHRQQQAEASQQRKEEPSEEARV
tara:strand:- start:104 stop:1321 length:1218 start_codon:yes stop_codon:yes gene_type:complete